MSNKFETQFGQPSSESAPGKVGREDVEQVVSPEASQAEADPRIEEETNRMIENAERIQEAMGDVDPEKLKNIYPKKSKREFILFGEICANSGFIANPDSG